MERRSTAPGKLGKVKPRVQGELAKVKEVKATEGEMKKKTEGGSR